MYSTQVLTNRENLMLQVLEYVLMIKTKDIPEHPIYTEAARELRQVCNTELQRIPMRMPNNLARIYSQLEAKIIELTSMSSPEDREFIAFQTFLYIINHRASADLIDDSTRAQRAESFLSPIRSAWQNPQLAQSLSSYSGFCQMMNLDRVQEYLVSRRVMDYEDWSQCPLDAEGQALQASLNDKFRVSCSIKSAFIF
jgi:exportin-5